MGNPIIDLSGQKFNRLTAVRVVGRSRRYALWLCRCDCGRETTVIISKLRSGAVKSCGCLKLEQPTSYTHGQSRSRTYACWSSMRQRCSNPKVPGYKNYGGRGISVCERWQSFENFLADMGPIPAGGSIERNDVDGNYEPSNCRWIPRNKQQLNQRTNRFVEFGGERLTTSQLANRYGIKPNTLRQRLDAHWDIAQAIKAPARVYQLRKKI